MVVTKWICIDNFILSRADKVIILNGEDLSDKHINASQKLLTMQFPTLTGFSMTLKQRVVRKLRSNIALSWLSLDNYKHNWLSGGNGEYL